MVTARIILVEGVDFVGKTTFAKELCLQLNDAMYQHTPLYEDDTSAALNSYVKNHPEESSTRKVLSLAENALAINYCNSLKELGFSVVLDRSVFSFLAYQGVTMRQWGVMKNILDFPELHCDGVFILDASPKELARRRIERSSDSLDEYFMKNLSRITKRYKEAYVFHNVTCKNVHCLDTTGKTPEQSLDEAKLVMQDWFRD